MNHLLQNPVYNALASKDGHLSSGTEKVKFFPESVSPFAGFEEGHAKGFEELADLLPTNRFILYAAPFDIQQPDGWEILQKTKGLQMILPEKKPIEPIDPNPVALKEEHVEQMMQLTNLTKPGPFGKRTIDFGHYYGIFDQEQLVAMAGQRLHVNQFTEISAVCTHPNYLGKGYASALLQHLSRVIIKDQQTPFLHVREDNAGAIAIYQKLGFKISRPMNFYSMKKI